jgi:hypothetical protein
VPGPSLRSAFVRFDEPAERGGEAFADLHSPRPGKALHPRRADESRRYSFLVKLGRTNESSQTLTISGGTTGSEV